MKKDNFVTTAIDGMFAFLETGWEPFDRWFKRLVSITLLLTLLIWSVSALVSNVYVGGVMISDMATTAVVVTEPAIQEASVLVDDAIVMAEDAATAVSDAVTFTGFTDDEVATLDAALEAVVGEVPPAPPPSK